MIHQCFPHENSIFLLPCLITGWWLSPTPLKNDGVSNSWDDDIPNIWKIKTTNQNIDMINIIKDTSIGKLDTVDRLD